MDKTDRMDVIRKKKLVEVHHAMLETLNVMRNRTSGELFGELIVSVRKVNESIREFNKIGNLAGLALVTISEDHKTDLSKLQKQITSVDKIINS